MGLAAVFLVHPDWDVSGRYVLPVVPLDRQDREAGDVGQFRVGYRQPAGGGEPVSHEVPSGGR